MFMHSSFVYMLVPHILKPSLDGCLLGNVVDVFVSVCSHSYRVPARMLTLDLDSLIVVAMST